MAIAFTPGQIVSSSDWDALFTQHGGMSNDTPASRQSPTEADIKAAALAGDDDPAAQQRPIYRYALIDGSYVDARTSPDGKGWQVVDYKPSPKFTQAQAKATAAAPENQTPAQQNEAALNQQRAKNAALPPDQDPRYETDQERASRADATVKAQQAEAEKNKPQPGKPYQNAQGQWVVPVVAADGTVTTKPLPPEAIPQQPSEAVNAPPTQKWITTRKGDTYETVLNPNWKPPSSIVKDQNTGKYIEITEDPETGKPVIRPVTDQTTIKPADLPVLQTKYGEIASGLAALAKDLNEKVARGEITDKERTDAFAAAHGQAETAVAEINSILDNSKAIWSGQVTQRGQTLQDTQGRRSYASDIARSAMSTGENIALHSGRGSGAAIAAGVGALMRMGSRYAADLGGLRESPEIALPAALQQAQGIGLPGFGANAAPGGPPAAPSTASVAPGAPAGPGGPPAPPPPSGISNTTDAGGVPREYTPASSSVGSGLPPGPPPPLGQGQDLSTPLTGMGSALAAGNGYAGSPVAAGGSGVFDPMLEAQGMLGNNADPAWAEAVRRAAAFHAGAR